ncbi:MAG: redoxin family protein, partial [Planctomycetota bacterium]
LAAELSKAKLPKAARHVRGEVLNLRVQGAARRSPKDLAEAVEEVNQHLAKGPIQATDHELAVQVARLAERIDQAELATDVLRNFSKQCAASKNRQIAGLAKAVEPTLRRVSLPGNPMKVEGTLLGGGKFDLSKHRGRVVLIDFWATWCGPCVAEVPNMKKTYEKYHDRGFDIVGISHDRSRKDLEEFIQKREIPWTILFEDGGRNATADYYGISAIPTMILIGRDGNVASLNARGPQLPAKLEKLLSQAAVVASVDPKLVDTPKDAPKKEPPKKNEPLKKPVVIKITAKGVASIDGKPFGGGKFLDLMASKVPEADRASTPIRIEASADVKHENAMRGINALKKMGFRVFKYVKR